MEDLAKDEIGLGGEGLQEVEGLQHLEEAPPLLHQRTPHLRHHASPHRAPLLHNSLPHHIRHSGRTLELPRGHSHAAPHGAHSKPHCAGDAVLQSDQSQSRAFTTERPNLVIGLTMGSPSK